MTSHIMTKLQLNYVIGEFINAWFDVTSVRGDDVECDVNSYALSGEYLEIVQKSFPHLQFRAVACEAKTRDICDKHTSVLVQL